MQRYFIILSYKGTNFSGWQRQLNAHTIQEELEDAFQLLFKYKVNIIGCGRTDSGVHATNYVAHFDLLDPLVIDLKFKLNHIVSSDIVVHDIFPVKNEAHTRFDATKRSYTYEVSSIKNPFRGAYIFYYPQIKKLKLHQLNEVASILYDYTDFYTFCKSKTDVKTTICTIYNSRWQNTKTGFKYHISANRFLRGMVRLIVGMCINVALEKLDIEDVKKAISNKKRLDRDWSVPAQGLMLHSIQYPYPFDTANQRITIEEGSIQDVIELSRQIPEFIEPHDAQEYQKRLGSAPHLILVARCEGNLAGFKVGYERTSDGSFYSWMGGVLEDYRRLGIAHKLADAQDAWALNQNYNMIKFKTKNRLKAMQKFALQRGFTMIAFEPNEDAGESKIWYERKLQNG